MSCQGLLIEQEHGCGLWERGVLCLIVNILKHGLGENEGTRCRTDDYSWDIGARVGQDFGCKVVLEMCNR